MKVITYLTFTGECEQAMQFYKEVLGGEILQMSRMGDSQMEMEDHLRNKIMHARLRLGDNVLYMSDTFAPASVVKGSNVSLSIDLESVEEMEKLFNGLSAGGTVTMPLQDAFWGARFGMLTDKFGIHWMMNCEIKK
jgi:PhnB protein